MTEPEETSATPTEVGTPPPYVAPAPAVGRVEARRQAVEALVQPSGAPQADSSIQIAEQRQAQQRLAAVEPLWPIVNIVLGVVQSEEVLQELTKKFEFTRSLAQDEAQHTALKRTLGPYLSALPSTNRMSGEDLEAVITLVYDELLGISVLGQYWRDKDVDEILVDGWDSITVEKHGQLIRTGVRFRDPEHARTIARALAGKISDRALTPKNPIVDAELPGARVAFVIGKLVKSGLAIAIRKARPLMGMTELIKVGALDQNVEMFLADCVRARANIIVSGGTSSGKTTVINAMSAFIPATERVITIEDTYELALTNMHRVHLQTKGAASADDSMSIGMAELLKTTLRMRPDRVIVGEIRDGSAALVMMDAANTGHDGTMTTIHANSAERAVNFRLVQLLRRGADMSDEVAKNEISSAVDLVVQVVKRGGRRYIDEVAVVDSSMSINGYVHIVPIFKGHVELQEDGSTLTVFTQVGKIRADTDLAMKIIDQGLGDRWLEFPEEV